MAVQLDRVAMTHRTEVCRLMERQLKVFDALIAQKLLVANRIERFSKRNGNEKATVQEEAF